ncbi:photosystem reaction center protein H [Serratia sp. S1B]|nr:photosystem reaction center protein H [Serratia sp. S1B]
MKNSISSCSLTVLVLTTCLNTLPAVAQQAGSTTTVDVSITESTQATMGWSVKKSLLGKTLYNDTNQAVGKVEDLIIAPDTSVSYVIVGAGGFIGIDRHDVAIPVKAIKEQGGKLVMTGATKDSVKAMPAFSYATDKSNRDQFIAMADKDIAQGKATIADLQIKADTAAADSKEKIEAQINVLKADVTEAEVKLVELKQASIAHWKKFETGVSESTTRLRKSVAKAVE